MINVFDALTGNWRRMDTSVVPTDKGTPGCGQPVTLLESQVCLCSHTYYMHGDRAVALCGGAERGTVALDAPYWERGLQCTCSGFRTAL